MGILSFDTSTVEGSGASADTEIGVAYLGSKVAAISNPSDESGIAEHQCIEIAMYDRTRKGAQSAVHGRVRQGLPTDGSEADRPAISELNRCPVVRHLSRDSPL